MMNNQENITNYVTKLTESQITKLYHILKDKGCSFSELPYGHWKTKLDKTNISAYKSGKLVVQGKGTGELVLFILEPEVLKKAELGYENILNGNDENTPAAQFTPHIGIDESGKGDFFGPLVVAAVFVDERTAPLLEKIGAKDSKLIKNDVKIAQIAAKIRETVNGKYTVVAIGPESYNKIYKNFSNLNKLLAWGHARSLENLLEKDVECSWALSDKFGNEKLILNALFKKGKSIELKQQTKAESDIAVAAASILARAEFVRRIKSLEGQYSVKLPKGAGKKVLEEAVNIIKKNGSDSLNSVAKLHFTTYQKALAAAGK